MQKRFFSRFGIIFLLMLVFFQQVGAGLYIHNIWHAEKTRQSHSQHQEINFTCNCVDNFLTPFIENVDPVFEMPLIALSITPAYRLEKIYFTSPAVTALRGPPVS
jgi:hypothetical protein